MKALIISSYDKSIFPHLDAAKFFKYLVDEVGMIKDNIFFYGRAEYEAKIGFYNVLLRVSELSANEPLIVYYSGHGLKTGWDFKDDVDISYEIIFNFLGKRKAPLIFINDCCYGMVAADFMEKINHPKMLIGLSPKDCAGESSRKSILLTEIFRYWRRGLPANPRFCVRENVYCRYLVKKKVKTKVNLRWGNKLDRFVFPSKFRKRKKK
ncbi:MAG: hypothetical protein Q7S81_03420 [bacterium]|nr:hypothetical protein [bacterium]